MSIKLILAYGAIIVVLGFLVLKWMASEGNKKLGGGY